MDGFVGIKMKLGEEDVAALRAITPGAEKIVHLNNAGCSLPSQPTLDAAVSYLHKEATIGGYETFDASAAELKRPYTALASLLNCEPEEIAVTTSATDAWQQVVFGLAWTWRPGDRILTSVSEYGSNYIAYLQLVKRTGVQIEILPETATGDICLESLEAALTRKSTTNISGKVEGKGRGGNAVLVSINHVPTSSGRVYNAEAVGALTRKHGVLYLLDACQSVGQMPVDVQRIGCDFLSGTGRKYLRAPRGSGFLYCSKDAMEEKFEPATLDNTGAAWTDRNSYAIAPTAKRFERYEMSFAAKVGLGVAVQACFDLGINSIWERISSLANILRQGLAEVPGVQVLDHGEVLCGLVSFIKQGITPDALQKELHERGINTSISRTGSSRIDFESRGLTSVVRASVHYYNTEDEVQKLVDVVRQIG